MFANPKRDFTSAITQGHSLIYVENVLIAGGMSLLAEYNGKQKGK